MTSIPPHSKDSLKFLMTFQLTFIANNFQLSSIFQKWSNDPPYEFGGQTKQFPEETLYTVQEQCTHNSETTEEPSNCSNSFSGRPSSQVHGCFPNKNRKPKDTRREVDEEDELEIFNRQVRKRGESILKLLQTLVDLILSFYRGHTFCFQQDKEVLPQSTLRIEIATGNEFEFITN